MVFLGDDAFATTRLGPLKPFPLCRCLRLILADPSAIAAETLRRWRRELESLPLLIPSTTNSEQPPAATTALTTGHEDVEGRAHRGDTITSQLCVPHGLSLE